MKNFFLTTIVYALSWCSFAQTYAVVYPEARMPFAQIYSDMLEGIKLNTTKSISTLQTGPATSKQSIKEWLAVKNPQVIILLGTTQAVEIVGENIRPPIIIGGVISKPEVLHQHIFARTLSPHPRLIVQHAILLKPQLKNIYALYEIKQNQWVIELTEKNIGHVEIRPLPVSNISEAATTLRDALKIINPSTDAIWLLHDIIAANEEVVLTPLLKASWEKNLLTISSNPSHVARGIVFSFLPQNKIAGKNLVELADKINANEKQVEQLGASDTGLWVVNIRTAKHLQLQLSREVEEKIDVILPKRQ